jgi:hypothetical protein
MSELISGKEAKLAWANGKKLQIANMIVGEGFYDMDDSNTTLNIFDLDFYQFRLKPRTVNLNGIEVPAPFEPKVGDTVWCISDDHGCGYCTYEWIKNHSVVIGAWRTEEEIKQVVSALRSVFKGGV